MPTRASWSCSWTDWGRKTSRTSGASSRAENRTPPFRGAPSGASARLPAAPTSFWLKTHGGAALPLALRRRAFSASNRQLTRARRPGEQRKPLRHHFSEKLLRLKTFRYVFAKRPAPPKSPPSARKDTQLAHGNLHRKKMAGIAPADGWTRLLAFDVPSGRIVARAGCRDARGASCWREMTAVDCRSEQGHKFVTTGGLGRRELAAVRGCGAQGRDFVAAYGLRRRELAAVRRAGAQEREIVAA